MPPLHGKAMVLSSFMNPWMDKERNQQLLGTLLQSLVNWRQTALAQQLGLLGNKFHLCLFSGVIVSQVMH